MGIKFFCAIFVKFRDEINRIHENTASKPVCEQVPVTATQVFKLATDLAKF